MVTSACLFLQHDFTSTILKYAVPSVQGFFRSIALSQGNSLQDTLRFAMLRLLSLVFESVKLFIEALKYLLKR